MELDCAVQNYAWGKRGLESSVAQLAKASKKDLQVTEDQTYAELWMGTHPSGPSFIKESGIALENYIEQHPEVLGDAVVEKFGVKLPFLFKVLSVNQALSIQAHPNKSHAEELHRTRPDVYKDPNHKPEMTIALTPFQALCGFRPQEEIIKHLRDIEELQQVIGKEIVDIFIANPSQENLKACFRSMMTASKDNITSALLQRLSFLNSSKERDELQELFLTLHQKYPGDVGCFSIYLLNYLTLQPGQAMFLGPNIIHAYLLGDCIECMACSDNVVRAGLTPKYQDTETLVEMLDYEMGSADSWKFKGNKNEDWFVTFNPPVPDFAVDMIEIPAGVNQYTLKAVASASILLIVSGQATKVEVSPIAPEFSSHATTLQRGSVLFLGAGQNISFNLDEQSIFLAFRVLCIL